MKYLIILTQLFLISSISVYATEQEEYNIEITVEGFGNEEFILGYYYNKSMYVKDTVKTNQSGTAVFQGDEALPGGLYLIYLPDGNYFDLLINEEQNFKVSTSTPNLIEEMQISGAKESSLFLEYQKMIKSRQSEASQLQQRIENETDSDKKERLQQQLRDISTKVDDFTVNSIEKNQGTFYATFLKGLRDPEIPDFEIDENVSNPDSIRQMKRYHFMRRHFFDNIDMSDKRILRTPYFANRIDNYFERAVIQHPDTVLKASMDLVEMSRENDEVFRFVLQNTFNRANESNIMGMDAVLVGLAEKYYLTGEAPWATDQFLTNLKERVNALKPTLIGNKAQELKMNGYDGNQYSLHNIDAEVTVVLFYEPSCSHCKVVIPKLYNDIYPQYNKEELEVFAVYTLGDVEEWHEYVEENEIFEWINVADPTHRSQFRHYYDIRSTPLIYVLDNEKKIAAKRIDVEQLPGFIDHLLNN
ncbi:thioredoxin-like domain-containing protein [Marinilabiliaceae bacterium ANBcel2]|nr:thioredoxin-like domain-containing protein [Marinilabiliaceae bacterium ANBcel2]